MAPIPALLVTPVEAQKSLTASGVLTTRKPNPIEAIKAKLKETAQKEVANKMSQTEEEQQQDNLDSELERVSNKDSQTEEPEEDDDNNLLG